MWICRIGAHRCRQWLCRELLKPKPFWAHPFSSASPENRGLILSVYQASQINWKYLLPVKYQTGNKNFHFEMLCTIG
jgi:hypothetical protein